MSQFGMKLKSVISRSSTTLRPLDVIIFGASGTIGRCIALEAVNILKDFQWGIAGRNRFKLEALLDEISTKTCTNLYKVPIQIANIDDTKSLSAMAEKCRIVVNCCGPYQIFGERIIQACLEAGTHYVDMCFEPHFMELMQLKYNEAAKLKNVYIISACGFESLPIEIGINYLEQKFSGTINSIEAYTEFSNKNRNILTPLLSYTTWSSLVLACANIRVLPAIRKRLHTKAIPELSPKTFYKSILHQSNIIYGYCLPFPVSDQQVVERTQYYFFDQFQKRPIQFYNYLAVPYFCASLCFLLWCFLITLLAQIEFTRNLLLRYPKIFSLGFVTTKGLDQAYMDKIFFRVTLNAEGWWERSQSSIGNDTNHVNMPEKRLLAKIFGMNPLYGVTAVCILVSAVTILVERKKLPDRGGVYTPGAAFVDTDIINELSKYGHGVHYEIVLT